MNTLSLSLENNILTIRINRPDKLNALTREVITDLEKAFDEAEKNNDVRGIVITGEGPKAFVAGADISEFSGLSPAALKRWQEKGIHFST